MVSLFKIIFNQDLRLYYRRKTDIFNVVAFFFLTVILFPFGVGTSAEILHKLAFGAIWVALIFACMLGISRLFEPDYEDGTINLYKTLPYSIEVILFAKIAANWVAFLFPLIISLPVAAFVFGLNFGEAMKLGVSLIISSPALVMVGAIGNAVSLGARRGQILLNLLVTPFYVPIIIFGASQEQNISVLIGLSLFFIPLSVWACSYIIRQD